NGGNANRFITERQCMRNCSHRADELFPKDKRQACNLPKKPGECVGHYLRYYGPEHHTCKDRLCGQCYNAADEGLEDCSGASDVPVGIILGVVFGLTVAVILIVVIVFAVKKKNLKETWEKRSKSAEQPLKEQAIKMGDSHS
ncbi:BPTI/Kunitz domain-containing protein, partial [Cyprinus carpio]|uniref:BPTI/Kunitz domain-containing protein n=1 Tax=Cyprinus carpio TaxID=7962 RepID=A0A9R0AT36_CYPCA